MVPFSCGPFCNGSNGTITKLTTTKLRIVVLKQQDQITHRLILSMSYSSTETIYMHNLAVYFTGKSAVLDIN